MDYQKHYNLLIGKAIQCNRKRYKKSDKRYICYEKHHIIPKCLGGTNDRNNLVLLTPEEHYVAHQLLVKVYPDIDKLIFAAHRMCSGISRNNKLYGWVRRQHADAMSRLHKGKKMSNESREKMSISRTGKKHSAESIKNMCEAQKNRSPETRKRISESHMGHNVTNETKEKLRQANLGKHHTEETCKKMSESRRGENNSFYGKTHSEETRQKMKEQRARQVITEETKQKISASSKGRVVSDETKAKMSASRIGKERPPVSAETRAKNSASHKGKERSEEAKLNMIAGWVKRRADKAAKLAAHDDSIPQ